MDLRKIASAVRMGRKFGMTDMEILKALMLNVGPPDHRREIVVEWSKAVGLDASTALREAHKAALIPTTSPPRSLQGGKLHDKAQEKIPE